MAERTRWKAGDTVSARVLVASDDSRVAIPPVTGWTHLQFRRFAGCPICSLHLAKLSSRRAEIEAAGVAEVVVFRSSNDALRLYHAEVPFACVADPEGVVYEEFGVRSSPRSLLHPRAMVMYMQGVAAAGSLLGSFSKDDHLGLPADFLVGREGRLAAVHYGEHADDGWLVDDLLAHVRAADREQ